MMDDGQRSRPFGFGGLGGASSPGMMGSAGAMGSLSPYLNVDPSYLQSETPEFIFNQDQKRGWLENSFTAIGSSVLVGGAMGGTYGLYDGIRKTALTEMRGKLRRTQILNHTLKSGGMMSNTLASVAVIYSTIHVLLSQLREEDDEIKSMASGALTGALYKSTAGLRKCGISAAIGMGAATLWSLVLKKDKRISNYI